MRLTIACPEGLIPDGRHLAMCLGYGPADANTYRTADWQDADGNFYAAASTLVFGVFIGKATSTLLRPDWDVAPYQVNMAAANRAQAALAFIPDPYAPGVVTVARPDRIVAILHDDPQEALRLLGVAPVPAPEQFTLAVTPEDTAAIGADGD